MHTCIDACMHACVHKTACWHGWLISLADKGATFFPCGPLAMGDAKISRGRLILVCRLVLAGRRSMLPTDCWQSGFTISINKHQRISMRYFFFGTGAGLVRGEFYQHQGQHVGLQVLLYLPLCIRLPRAQPLIKVHQRREV